MSTRSYVSTVRTAAAAEKRDRMVQAATDFLREESITAFSLDAVARAAGVTRLTVYNQFGSRRGLLEAAFDRLAQHGGLLRIAEAMTSPDPRNGVALLVEIFCDFWSSDPAIARLHDAMVLDPEFAQALLERNERRRQVITTLIVRTSGSKTLTSMQRETIDLIFALTSCAMYRMLGAERSARATCDLIKRACEDAIRRIT